MNKIKQFTKSRAFPIVLTVLMITVMMIIAAPYVYDSFTYNDCFYISYAQYPGATPSYREFFPKMTQEAPEDYDGLEFIGWYYLDNGVEKEFIPSEFIPPDDPVVNYLSVYGRWKSVALDGETVN